MKKKKRNVLLKGKSGKEFEQYFKLWCVESREEVNGLSVKFRGRWGDPSLRLEKDIYL